MKVFLSPKAQRDLKKLPPSLFPRLSRAIDALEKNPLPLAAVKLTNQPGYRLRLGNFRVLYLFSTKEKTVLIVRVAHRREVYRNL